MGQQNEIEIGFSLFSQGIPDYFGITTGTIIGVRDEDLRQIRSSTLFKYPSDDHIGELMNSTGNSRNILDGANEKIQLGKNLAISGNVMMVIFGISLAGIAFGWITKRFKP